MPKMRAKMPPLTAEQQALVTSHRDFAIKQVIKMFQGYVPEDAVSEALVGLCLAAQRFRDGHGAQFHTYAAYWIRAIVFEYMLANRTIVKFTTSRDRRAFFNFSRARRIVGDDNAAIAAHIGVDEETIALLRVRLSGRDLVLDAPRSHDDDRSSDLVDETQDPESDAAAAHVIETVRNSVKWLDHRERKIIRAMCLTDEPRTQRDLGKQLGISSERVRQLKKRALAKMKEALTV